jgi:hypothetical protein
LCIVAPRRDDENLWLRDRVSRRAGRGRERRGVPVQTSWSVSVSGRCAQARQPGRIGTYSIRDLKSNGFVQVSMLAIRPYLHYLIHTITIIN